MDSTWSMFTAEMLIADDGLPTTGYLRLPAILAVIPVSRSTWWNGVKEGRFPQPTKKFGPRVTAWDVRGIRELIKAMN
jgi:predicted DNA-binding transcriptional regulator AlpA